MSVLAAKRKESKNEAITFSIELHNMLIELMQRSFGIKDVDQVVRIRYAYGMDPVEDFAKYRYLMTESKTQINHIATLLTCNLRAAKSLYPTSMHEYEKKNLIKLYEDLFSKVITVVNKKLVINDRSPQEVSQEVC